MDTAFQWIGQIASWIGAFIPRWVILDTTEAGVKFVKGKPKECPSGSVAWYWPVTTSWSTYPIARQTDRLETQVMESRDGMTFLVSGTLTYEVEDIMLLVPMTHSPMHTIVDMAMTSIHDVCCEFEWGVLQEMQRRKTIKTVLKNEAQKQLKDYGVRVLKLQLNTLARCRVFKLSQSTSSEEN